MCVQIWSLRVFLPVSLFSFVLVVSMFFSGYGLTLPDSLYLHIYLYLCICIVSPALSLPLSVCLHACFCVFLYLSLPLCFCMPYCMPYVSVCVCTCFFSTSPCAYWYTSLSELIYVPVCVSLSISVCFFYVSHVFSCLVLDEPSSGLDSSNAHNIMALLKKVAHDRRRTVLCSVHQPRADAFQVGGIFAHV